MDTKQEKIDLSAGAPPLGFKPQGTAAELRMLEMECAFLNNPAISGDKKGADKEKPAPSAAQPVTASPSTQPVQPAADQDGLGATPLPPDPIFEGHGMQVQHSITPPPQPIVPPPAPVIAAPDRILLTGRTGVGKSFLAQRSGAHVLELDDPIRRLAIKWLGNVADGPAADALVETIYQWGNGQVSAQYPLTPARLLFATIADGSLVGPDGNCFEYGKPGCWIKNLIQRANNLVADGKQVIVTGVNSVDDYKALVAAGFRHYHVVCSPASYTARPKRKTANDNLAAAFDKDISVKLSRQPQGERLRCIWSDVSTAHNRLFSVEQWLQAITIIKPEPLGEIAFE